jgi:putative polyketide hydroxylase
MEILRALDLEPEVRRLGQALDQNRYFLAVESLAGREWKRAEMRGETEEAETARTSPTRWGHAAQDELEALLLGHARRSPVAAIGFGQELVELSQDRQGVTAVVADRASGARRLLRARYLLAADGAHSTVRRLLGIGVRGPGRMNDFVNVYFRADLEELTRERPFILCAIKSASFTGLMLSVNNVDRWLLNVPAPISADGTPGRYSDEECRQLVRIAVGLPELEVEILSALGWTAAAQVAERFGDGRVLLAGDAAHVVPPAGAFGMNAGIQDVHNLAWKLAAVVQGWAGPSLLASYEDERLPVAWFTAEQAALRMREMGVAGSLHEAARAVTQYRGANRWGEGQAHGLSVAFGYRYRSSAVMGGLAADEPLAPMECPELRGQPGSRVPHVWLDGAERVSTVDLCRDRFVLLTRSAAWHEAALRVQARLPIPFVSHRVGPGGDFTGDRFAAAVGVGEAGALLVRPDGFVAWRSVEEAADPASLLLRVMVSICDIAPAEPGRAAA